MSMHEFTGKTTEEAISEGLRKLSCTISDVKVTVLEEGAKGLFGLFGSKQARVRLTLDNSDDDTLSALSSLSLDYSFNDHPERSPKQPPKPTAKAAQAQPAPVQPAKPRMEKPAAKPQQAAPARPQAEKPRQPAKQPDARAKEPTAYAPIAPSFQPKALAEGETPTQHDPGTAAGCAQRFLTEVTRLMQVSVAVDVQHDPDGNLFVQMVGDTLGILIGRRGETLDALQYLTSLQVNKGRDEYIRVTLDTENYRAKREDSLRRLAARMAVRAYKTGRKVAMEPMNPYERRILHASLQNHPHVVTHSEGEEPNRHVVITLKSDDGVQRQAAPRREH